MSNESKLMSNESKALSHESKPLARFVYEHIHVVFASVSMFVLRAYSDVYHDFFDSRVIFTLKYLFASK